MDAAIGSATAAYQANPADLRNLFNLAVYHGARGKPETAEARHRDAPAKQPDAALRRTVGANLKQYLSLCPAD